MTISRNKKITKVNQAKELPIMSFDTAIQWERWLARNHDISDGIWLRIQRKDSGRQSVTYVEALDVALCYGWIDGQKKSNDGGSWFQKFIRRSPQSCWSKKNTEHVERLTKSGKMKTDWTRRSRSSEKGRTLEDRL